MKYKCNRHKRGFTLIELLLAVALISLVIIISTNLIILAVKGQKLTVSEYSIQSSIKRSAEQLNQTIRYSKAVFAVPETFVTETAMDPEWSFFMVSEDKKRIVVMEYNNTTEMHEEKVIVGEQNNVIYKVLFEKDPDATMNNIMIYKIFAIKTDKDQRPISNKLIFESVDY